MQIKKTSESLTITVDLTDAPSMQMFSGVDYTANPVGFYTWAPRTAAVFVVDGAFHSIALHYDHSMGRTFKADDANMPNWIRSLVSEILAGRDVEWPQADDRANEWIIERREDNEVVMSVAIVSLDEVRQFLRAKRDLYQPRDFFVGRTDGGGTVAGDLWLMRHHSKATV